MNRKLAPLFCLTIAACATGGTNIKLPKIKQNTAHVFTGPKGIELTIVTLEDGTRLAHLSGIDSILSGKVVRATTKKVSSTTTVNVTQVNGKGRWFFHEKSNRYRPGAFTYNLFAPKSAREYKGVELYRNAARSKTVNTNKLREKHLKQLADGTLANLAKFDRPKTEKKALARLSKVLASANKTCSTSIKASINWKTIDDKIILAESVSSRCGFIASSMRHLCKFNAAKTVFKSAIKEIRCAYGPRLGIKLEDGVLHWTLAKGSKDAASYATKSLFEMPIPGKGENLMRHILLDESHVCAKKDAIYAGFYLDAESMKRATASPVAFYGKGSKFHSVRRVRFHAEDVFFDPRFESQQESRFWRGVDMKHVSRITIDKKSKKCVVTCGRRKIELNFVDEKTKAQILANAPFDEAGPKRIPYSLARDRRGTYYFVDRGAEKGSRDFRLFIGKAGRMRLKPIKKVASDSKGHIFSTKYGTLKLETTRGASYMTFWIRHKKKARKLTNVPIQRNWGFIYRKLGPYKGKPYGTPCDVL